MSLRPRYAVATALLGVLGLGLTQRAAAQTSATASVNATAFVQGVAPLTATGVNNLDFGTVNAGTVKTPTSMASDAGRFNITGQASTPVTVSFTLPTQLTGFGGQTIPIVFNNTDGLHWTAYPTTFVAFDPNAPFLTSLGAGGTLVIGIAGSVAPPAATITGNYTGTVTLTVTY